jgi:hypothetical protein
MSKLVVQQRTISSTIIVDARASCRGQQRTSRRSIDAKEK